MFASGYWDPGVLNLLSMRIDVEWKKELSPKESADEHIELWEDLKVWSREVL